MAFCSSKVLNKYELETELDDETSTVLYRYLPVKLARRLGTTEHQPPEKIMKIRFKRREVVQYSKKGFLRA
jgi:hypothetical protein